MIRLCLLHVFFSISHHVQPDESFFSDDFLFPMSANSGSGSTSRLSYTSGIESDGEFIDSTPTPRASRNTLTGPPTMIPTPQSTANLPRCSSDPNLADDDVTDGNGEWQLLQTNGALIPLSHTLVSLFHFVSRNLGILALFRERRGKDPRLQCTASLRGLTHRCSRWREGRETIQF